MFYYNLDLSTIIVKTKKIICCVVVSHTPFYKLKTGANINSSHLFKFLKYRRLNEHILFTKQS